MALFRAGQLRWTVVGILCGVSAGTAYYTCAILLPKALVDQGGAVALSFGLSSLLFMASMPGQVVHRISHGGHRPAVDDRLRAGRIAARHRPDGWSRTGLGEYATLVMVTGALITGFTVLSAFTATRVYLSEQFPTALRGRGHIFGESTGRLFAGVLAPFLMEPYTASPVIFFGTIFVVVAIGAMIPRLFGRETVGQLETVTAGDRRAMRRRPGGRVGGRSGPDQRGFGPCLQRFSRHAGDHVQHGETARRHLQHREVGVDAFYHAFRGQRVRACGANA